MENVHKMLLVPPSQQISKETHRDETYIAQEESKHMLTNTAILINQVLQNSGSIGILGKNWEGKSKNSIKLGHLVCNTLETKVRHEIYRPNELI